MREIKFRAWYEEDKEMQRVTDIYFNKKTGEIESFVTKGEKCNYHTDLDNHILMQYTGLKDKNGVEIFEGDVVKILVDNGFDYVDGFGVVRFQQGKFVIDHNNLDTEFGWLYYAQDEGEIEIIGSIYENPDLMEV